MSGFWPSSFSTIQDLNGRPIVGAKAYFFAAGTTRPIVVYRDYNLTTPHPNPLETDGFGRFPAVFLNVADAFYRVRATTPGGSILYDSDTIPIIGPSEDGGGSPPAPFDPNALFKTGDLKPRYGEGFLEGFVRANGRSIGTATSGATERAAADCQGLYEYLWIADPNLTVGGGRGPSATADWSANKPLDLPDFRGRAIIGLDDMGNVAAGVVSEATVLGWKGGAQTHTLTTAEMPVHKHGITVSPDGEHDHGIPRGGTGGGNSVQNGPPTGEYNKTERSGKHSHTADIANSGGGNAHNNLQPSIAITVYIRL